MAGWLSSKLKVAENFLQQIDQQAAESLGKQDKPRSHDLNATAFGTPTETPSLQEQFKKKKAHETHELVNNNNDNSNRSVLNVNVRAEKARHLQGPKKSSSSVSVGVNGALQLQQEVTVIQDLLGKSHSPRVAKHLPDDWTELLASPELSTRGSSSNVGASDTTNSNFTGKGSLLWPSKDKDAYNNGGLPNAASKPLPPNSSNSKLTRSYHHQPDASASVRPLDSKRIVKQESKLREDSDLDSKSNFDVTCATHGLGHRDEQNFIIDRSFSIQGDGSSSSSSSPVVSEKVWDGGERAHKQSNGHIQTSEKVKQSNEVSSISGNNVSASYVKEDNLTRSQALEESNKASSESAFYLHLNNCDTPSCSQDDSFEQNDVGLTRTSENGMHNGKVDSHDISFEATGTDVDNIPRNSEDGKYQHSSERGRFTDALELHDDGMQRHHRQVQDIPPIKLDGVHVSSSESDERSETETDSASGSDSEDDQVERHKDLQRKRAAQAAAEATALEAAKAAIKEREEFVMKLEKEKERLELILARREEQQAREAAELQMNMKETIQAADLEKQKHNVTRMQALARVAKLETENADLAKSLAAVQRSLEVELDCVAELRQEIDSKEVAQAELARRLSLLRHKLTCSNEVEISKGSELEEELFEDKSLHLCQKIEELQVKVKQLEENIERTTEEWEGPTEVEVELESRLSQLTDHLIHKQAQVEALSAEKSTLLFRLDALSNALYEERYLAQSQTSKGYKSSVLLDSVSVDEDLEFGMARQYDSRNRGMYEHEGFEKNPLSFLLRQSDMLFSAGAYYLRRYGPAKRFALIYLLALHIWVIFVLFLRSPENESTKSGALFSLETINNATLAFNSSQS